MHLTSVMSCVATMTRHALRMSPGLVGFNAAAGICHPTTWTSPTRVPSKCFQSSSKQRQLCMASLPPLSAICRLKPAAMVTLCSAIGVPVHVNVPFLQLAQNLHSVQEKGLAWPTRCPLCMLLLGRSLEPCQQVAELCMGYEVPFSRESPTFSVFQDYNSQW